MPDDLPIRRCLTCDYPLDQLPTQRCPECGTDFDFRDRYSFRIANEKPMPSDWRLLGFAAGIWFLPIIGGMLAGGPGLIVAWVTSAITAPSIAIFCFFETGWTGGKRRRVLRAAIIIALLYLIPAILLCMISR